MDKLTADKLWGIWAGVTMTWDEKYRFNEKTYRANTERMCRAGVHDIYTSGSTGEFYALSDDEFCRMVDIQDEICGKHKMPLQIGCCSDNTRETIKLVEYAAGKKHVGAYQVNLPYWMELTDREMLQFFKDLYIACPDLPMVHYNISRTKRFLQGPDYLRILEVAPNIIGVKYTFAGSNFSQLQDAMRMTPQLSYFVGENLLVSAMMLGARGSYSSIIATNPVFMLEMFAHGKSGRWNKAIEMQKTVARFMSDTDVFIEARGEGSIDPVADKGLGVAAGCIQGSQRTRAPYIGWSNETVAATRKWLQQNYPQFVYGEQDNRKQPTS